MEIYFKLLSQFILKYIQAEKTTCKEKVFKYFDCDGAVCDQKHHQILFEDETIRVIDVCLEPQHDEIFHRHERFAFMYVDKPAKIEYYGNFENPQEILWANADLQPRFNMIPFEEMHKVKNVGDTDFRAFRIEMKLDISTLPNLAFLSKQILEFIKLQKRSLDDVRESIFARELSEKNKVITQDLMNEVIAEYDLILPQKPIVNAYAHQRTQLTQISQRDINALGSSPSIGSSFDRDKLRTSSMVMSCVLGLKLTTLQRK